VGLVAVKDPAVLKQLDGGANPVTDPALLSELEAGNVSTNLAKIDAQAKAESFEEPTTFEYLFNRIKKGASGFMGAPGDMLKMIRANPGRMLPPMLQPFAPLADAALKSVSPSEETVPTERVMATSGTYRDATATTRA
jgi:hypothetical protein